jgi:hypothetical protein
MVLVLVGVLAVAGCSAAASGDSASREGAAAKTGPAQKASACSLLDVDELPLIFGRYGGNEAFVGTRPDPVDGKRPWGCTWGNPTSYASVLEVSREDYRTRLEAPGVRLIPQGMAKGESFAVWPADDEPMTFAFTVGTRHYHFEVVPSRDGDYPGFMQNEIGQNVLRLLIPAMEEALA